MDLKGNCNGSETAVLFMNKQHAFLEYFAFYVIQNKYNDSLVFRLKFYERLDKDWVGKAIDKALIFKVGPGSGEVKVALTSRHIRVKQDFFISLECLMDEMDIAKFCYAASLQTPSYYKIRSFSKWHSTRGTRSGGGGADFNVLVSYGD